MLPSQGENMKKSKIAVKLVQEMTRRGKADVCIDTIERIAKTLNSCTSLDEAKAVGEVILTCINRYDNPDYDKAP